MNHKRSVTDLENHYHIEIKWYANNMAQKINQNQ